MIPALPLDALLARVVLGLIFGLILGSFTTMLSYRIPRRLSIVYPPSQCTHCKTRLAARDLVPVLSWLAGNGLCRHCGKAIGLRYLVIELATTSAITAAFVCLGIRPALIAAIAGIIAFVTLVTINIEKR